MFALVFAVLRERRVIISTLLLERAPQRNLRQRERNLERVSEPRRDVHRLARRAHPELLSAFFFGLPRVPWRVEPRRASNLAGVREVRGDDAVRLERAPPLLRETTRSRRFRRRFFQSIGKNAAVAVLERHDDVARVDFGQRRAGGACVVVRCVF